MANIFDQFDGAQDDQPEPEQEAIVGNMFDQFDASNAPQPTGPGTPGQDFGQGMLQGGMDMADRNLQDLAGDRSSPYGDMSLSEKIAQIPGAAIDLMTGGAGGEAMRRLDLGQYGPGIPSSPEGQLGADLAPAVGMLAGGVGPYAGTAAAGRLRKAYGADPQEVALASRMERQGKPREAYIDDAMAQSYPQGAPATKEQARSAFTEMKQADDYRDTIVSAKPKPPVTPKHTDINQPVPSAPAPVAPPKMPQTAYRSRIKELIEDRGDLISGRHQRELMADKGMTVAQFVKLKRQVGARTKAPKNDMLETPMAAQRRGAYSEAANALDQLELPDSNVALDMYGKGANLWKAASNYKRAQGLVNKHVKIGTDGNRLWNSKSFQDEIDKLEPRAVREMFGDKFQRIINAARRVTHRGYTARQTQKGKSDMAVWHKLRNWGLVGGVTYSATRLLKDTRTAVAGAPMVRKHSDR